MEKGYIDYFSLQQYLTELSDSKLVSKNKMIILLDILLQTMELILWNTLVTEFPKVLNKK